MFDPPVPTKEEMIARDAAMDQMDAASAELKAAKASGDEVRRIAAINHFWDVDARLMKFYGREYSVELLASIDRQRRGLPE